MNTGQVKTRIISVLISEKSYGIVEEIKDKTVANDLGLFMSNDMSFSRPTEHAVNKGELMSAQMMRTFQTRDLEYQLPPWKT